MGRAIPKHVTDALGAMPLFAKCSERELQKVARLGTTIEVEAGYVLAREGRRGFEFFVLLDGTASCTLDGRELARFEAGDYFGEMSLVDTEPRSATVTATTPCEVLVIDAREFHALFDLAPAATKRLLATMSERLRTVQSA